MSAEWSCLSRRSARRWRAPVSVLAWAALTICLSAAEVTSTHQAPSLRPGSSDFLQFLDGSSLHGKLSAIDPSQGIAWEHPDAKAPIRFKPDNLAWIRFEKPTPINLRNQPGCRFRFNNGDELFGNLASIDREHLELEAWFGGSLRTPRHALQSITFLSKGYSILYEGPTSGEGWVHGKTPRNWEYRDGTFVASGAGTLGRDLKLSGSSSIAFDLSWSGHFSLILALYTPVLDRFDYSSSSYMFYLSPGYITLQRVQGGAGAMNLGQAQIGDMSRRNKLHLEIRANKQESTLGLFVDGRLIQRWKDSAGFVGQGSGVVFFAQLEGPSIKISNIKVAQWEGDFGMETLTNAPTQNDLVFLVNRDKVSGRLEKLREGTLTVATGESSLDIPLARVTQISMGSPVTNMPAAGPWNIRAFFAGGGTVAFDLEQWKEGRVTGTSANFGKVAFDAESFRQLQFNLHRRKVEAEGIEILDEDVWELE